MSAKSPITTHVLDTAAGRPARAVPVRLEFAGPDGFALLGESMTDDDGRATDLLSVDHQLQLGTYRITFDVSAYQTGFYPSVSIDFRVEAKEEHYHVPLLLSPFGYSTYRGS